MNWTEKPTETGYYWARRKETGKIEPVYFDMEMAACSDYPICVKTLGWDIEELADNFDRWLKLEEPVPPVDDFSDLNALLRQLQNNPTSPTGEQG